MKAFGFCLLFIFLCQCATKKVDSPQSPLLPKSQANYQSKKTRSTKQYNDIDLNSLLYELSMNQPMENIGYQEKSFNTCQIKSNKSPNPKCEKLYLSRLNFQMMCRNSTGTVEKVTLRPLTTNRMRWKGIQKRGITSTDSKGYGRLGFVSRRPASRGHLYFYLGSKIARKKLKDQWKLVLPGSWCSQP